MVDTWFGFHTFHDVRSATDAVKNVLASQDFLVVKFPTDVVVDRRDLKDELNECFGEVRKGIVFEFVAPLVRDLDQMMNRVVLFFLQRALQRIQYSDIDIRTLEAH